MDGRALSKHLAKHYGVSAADPTSAAQPALSMSGPGQQRRLSIYRTGMGSPLHPIP